MSLPSETPSQVQLHAEHVECRNSEGECETHGVLALTSTCNPTCITETATSTFITRPTTSNPLSSLDYVTPMSTSPSTGLGGRVGNRPQTTRNEREDEILTASPSSSNPTSTIKKSSSVGREGLVGDIGQIEDVSNVQPGSSVTRVYKKCASNGSLAVYVGTRTLIVGGTHLEPLKGVLVLDRDSLVQNISNDFRIWGQITLTFRYGREDEEVLGLRFCNEAILALKQLWPPMQRDPEDPDDEDEELTPLQTVLLERIRSSAATDSIQSVPFVLCGGPVGLGSFPPPPSVLLAPAKPYRGSPIGTIYDLRIYASERPEERPPRRNLIRLALRAVQMPCTHVPFDLKGSLEARPTILSRGKIRFHCELNKNAVRYGEPLEVKVVVQNNSRSSIRKVVVSLIQQVDVCMFTSGKFKNTVGCADDTVLIVPGASLQKRYTLTPIRGPARQWLALEEAFGRDPVLAPSTILDNLFGTEAAVVTPSPQPQPGKARNVFAIIVSYYVKAKLVLGGLSLGQCVKVPFVLLPPENAEPDPYPQTLGEAFTSGVLGECSDAASPNPAASSAPVTSITAPSGPTITTTIAVTTNPGSVITEDDLVSTDTGTTSAMPLGSTTVPADAINAHLSNITASSTMASYPQDYVDPILAKMSLTTISPDLHRKSSS